MIGGDIVPWRLFTTWRTQKFLQTVCSLFFMLQLFNSLFDLARGLLFSTQLLLPPSRFPTAKNKTTPRAAAAAAFYDAVIELCCLCCCSQETLQEKHKKMALLTLQTLVTCVSGVSFFFHFRSRLSAWNVILTREGEVKKMCVLLFSFFSSISVHGFSFHWSKHTPSSCSGFGGGICSSFSFFSASST